MSTGQAAWTRQKDKSEIKSFLRDSAVLPSVYEARSDIRTNICKYRTPSEETEQQKTLPSRTQQCEDSFKKRKALLTSDRVLAIYDPTKSTRIYVDDGPAGLAATVAQLHLIVGSDNEGWNAYQSR